MAYLEADACGFEDYLGMVYLGDGGGKSPPEFSKKQFNMFIYFLFFISNKQYNVKSYLLEYVLWSSRCNWQKLPTT